MALEKVYTPMAPPSTIYKNDPRAVLSSAEQIIYDELFAHFTAENPLYTLPDVENGELQEREKFWLSRECILRYVELRVVQKLSLCQLQIPAGVQVEKRDSYFSTGKYSQMATRIRNLWRRRECRACRTRGTCQHYSRHRISHTNPG